MIIIIACIVIFVLILLLYMKFETKKIDLKRKCFTSLISKKEKEMFIKLISTVSNIFKKHDIEWSFIAGNLLAIYRYNSPILPWDDDVDIVVDKTKTDKSLKVLKQELPKYGMNITYNGIFASDGFNDYVNSLFDKQALYKISFNSDKKFITTFKDRNYTWPFVDLFIGCRYTSKWNSPHDLDINKEKVNTIYYSYKNYNIALKHPINGIRSKQNIKKLGVLDTCIDGEYSHRHESKIEKCLGKNIIPCKNIIKNY